MATAVTTPPEAAPRDPHQVLLMSSFKGAVYILFALGLIFAGLPMLWRNVVTPAIGEFLGGALLVLLNLPLIVGLVIVGKKLEGPHPQPGVRAGAFVLAFLLFMWM